MLKTRTLLLACLALLLVGCQSDQPPIGSNVTVQFRRDALGAASSLPISPRASSINGAETTLSGTLSEVNPEWVVLVKDKESYWIPRQAILLIRLGE